jgi:hypothetical protein
MVSVANRIRHFHGPGHWQLSVNPKELVPRNGERLVL